MAIINTINGSNIIPYIQLGRSPIWRKDFTIYTDKASLATGYHVSTSDSEVGVTYVSVTVDDSTTFTRTLKILSYDFSQSQDSRLYHFYFVPYTNFYIASKPTSGTSEDLIQLKANHRYDLQYTVRRTTSHSPIFSIKEYTHSITDNIFDEDTITTIYTYSLTSYTLTSSGSYRYLNLIIHG